jgi:hypothetical protein
MDLRNESYPPEYLRGIEHFNSGDYFEAHEAWEEIWLESTGIEKLFYQGLIQAAVALHHFSIGRYGAAKRMCEKAVSRLSQVPRVFYSLDVEAFTCQLGSFFAYQVADLQAGARNALPIPRIVLC